MGDLTASLFILVESLQHYTKSSLNEVLHLIPTTALSEDTSPITEEDTEDYTVETTWSNWHSGQARIQSQATKSTSILSLWMNLFTCNEAHYRPGEDMPTLQVWWGNCKCCVYWMETLKGITMIDWGYSIVFTKMSKKEDAKYIYTMIKVMLNNITTWIKTKNVKYQHCETFTLEG